MTAAPGLPDETLVHQSLQGDRDAFGALVRRYADQVLNVAYRMVGSRTEAEDLSQETFVAAYKALSHFRAEAKFSTWLYRIAVNKCKDWLKSKGHVVQQTDLEGDPVDLADRLPDHRTPEHALEQKELAGALEAAIGTLPVWYREAFILKHIEGLNYEEMSEVVGIAPDTLKMRVYKARVHLRARLAPLTALYPELTRLERD